MNRKPGGWTPGFFWVKHGQVDRATGAAGLGNPARHSLAVGGFADVSREGDAKVLASAVEPGLDAAFGALGDFGDLAVGEVLVVMEQDGAAKIGRKGGDGFAHSELEFVAGDGGAGFGFVAGEIGKRRKIAAVVGLERRSVE